MLQDRHQNWTRKFKQGGVHCLSKVQGSHHHNHRLCNHHTRQQRYPAYSHQSYSHQVGICHNDEGQFPTIPIYNDNYNDEGVGGCGHTR